MGSRIESGTPGKTLTPAPLALSQVWAVDLADPDLADTMGELWSREPSPGCGHEISLTGIDGVAPTLRAYVDDSVVEEPGGRVALDRRWHLPTAGIGRFDELYLRYKVHIPQTWIDSENAGDKLLGLLGKADDGTPFDLAWGGNRPGDSWSFRPIIGNNGRVGAYLYAIDPNANDPFGTAFNVFDLAQGWNEIMLHVKVNTPGVNDGVARLFVDGQVVFSSREVQWRDGDMADIDITLMVPLFMTRVEGAMELHYAAIELLVPDEWRDMET